MTRLPLAVDGALSWMGCREIFMMSPFVDDCGMGSVACWLPNPQDKLNAPHKVRGCEHWGKALQGLLLVWKPIPNTGGGFYRRGREIEACICRIKTKSTPLFIGEEKAKFLRENF